jgi:3-(3-hydroxy-phenyl)propionate hydroxylase
VQNIEQAEQIITITALDIETNQSLKYTANYLVGADGGRSIVRTALNIAMNALEPARDWVIVDTLLKNPADANLLPNSFRYVFNPERLTIFAYGIGINNRWEFQLGKDEAMPTDEVIKSWVAKDISLDKIDIIRIAKYAHNSLVATKWRENKIFLAGDAAHMMPPSAGQGLCSGVRDAVNLAWKLVAVIQNHAPHSLLDTYEEERKPHLLEILKRTLFFGNRLQGDNPLERLLRKIQIQAIEFITPLKEYLRATHNTPPIFTSGFLSKHSALSGKYLPQFAINNQLTDDIIGYNFVLVALPNSLTTEQIKQVKDKNFVILHENIDLSQTNYATWLQKNDIDFALIRPDKIIFGAGKKAKFDVIFSELA